MKKTIFIFLFFASIIFNLLFFSVGIYPVVKQKIHKKMLVSSENTDDYDLLERQIIEASMEMLASDEHYMPFNEHEHFIEELKKLGESGDHSHAWFDHPKGLLFSGMAAYAISRNDSSLMEEVMKNFDRKVIDNWEEIKDMVIVDQIPFGMAAVHLYRYSGEIKYKLLADELYRKTREMISTEHHTPLIFYRKNQNRKFYIVDTLGMICPFLIHYGKTFNAAAAVTLASENLEYYTTHGLDCDSKLPSHAVTQPSNIRIGPHNWGRGIGWYFFPISEYHIYVDNEQFSAEIKRLMESILILRNDDGLWNQFLGGSDKFDASATVMYMYGLNNMEPGTYSREDVFTLLKPHIYNGIIGPTSGGAFGINNYSRSFGVSEITQGIFMNLLSTAETEL